MGAQGVLVVVMDRDNCFAVDTSEALTEMEAMCMGGFLLTHLSGHFQREGEE